MRRHLLVVFTGTINPNVKRFTKRVDPLLREAEYLNVLEEYTLIDPPVNSSVRTIFAENSGYQSEAILRHCVSTGIDYLQLPQPKPFHSKGAGELELISGALELSQAYALKDTVVVKITGRYLVSNLRSLLRFASNAHFDVAANLYKRLTFADARLFMFRPCFFPYLATQRSKLDDSAGYFLEQALASAIFSSRQDGARWTFLNDVPIISGTSGTTGRAYKTDLSHILKERIKLAIYRRLYT
jgi:hypothetical protein